MTFEAAYYEAPVFWDDGLLTDPGNMRRFKETADLIPLTTRSLLDVGCGNGLFGKVLSERRPEILVTGLDRSEAALRHVTTEKMRGAADAIPADDRAFDCVTCLEVIEHLTCPDFEKALNELRRVARTSIVIGVPYRENLTARMTQCPSCHSQFHTGFHLRSFDSQAIESLLPRDEFKVKRTIFPGSKSRLRWIDPALNKLEAMGRKSPNFLSPICPVCGYSDGKGAERIKTWIAPQKPRRSLPRRFAASALNATKSFLPKETVPGYWIAALYERV